MNGAYPSIPLESPRPRVVLLVYYALALVCSPLNRLIFGDYASVVSISYVPLVILLASYALQSLRLGIDQSLALLFVGIGGIAVIAAIHLTGTFDPFLLKFPLFYLLALLVAVNTTKADARAIVRVTYLCATLYVIVGVPLWYRNVASGVLTPASFSEAMFFQKQDYTVVLTLLTGLFLHDLLLSNEHTRRRRYVMLLQATAIVIGATLFYIKSLFVVVGGSIVALWLLGVRRARKYVIAMLLGVVVLYATYERLILSDLLPDQVVAYIAWLFDDRYLTSDGARSLDTLTMRLAILADNFDAMKSRISSILFGIGTNTAADASFISYLSGREGDLPIEMESGILQIFVYTGAAGLAIVLASYVYGFKAWAASRARFLTPETDDFSRIACANLALLTSNIFQDNLASVTWYWLGLMWCGVVQYRRAARLESAEHQVDYARSPHGVRQGVVSRGNAVTHDVFPL